MQKYADTSGQSGVVAFEIGDDWIDVQFTGGDVYRYTVERAGFDTIETMMELALAGRGLSAFISRHVRDRYARKL